MRIFRPKYRLVGLLLIILLAAAVYSANAREKFPFTVKLVLSSAYDDNILKYSSFDVERFENSTEPFPSEITTTDDWINTLGIKVYRDFKLSNRWKLRPYYYGKVQLYAVNQVKNMTSHFFLLRIGYRNRYFGYFKYSFLPGYYLRIYRDRDLNEPHGCEFDLSKSAVAVRADFRLFELEGELGRELVYYNSHFTEYDSEAWYWGLAGTFTWITDLQMTAGFSLKISDNIGFDQSTATLPGSATEDTEYGDGSYQEDQYNLSLVYDLPVESSWNWRVSFTFEQRWRYYQSDLTVANDPFHAGRRDRRSLVDMAFGFVPYHQLDVELRFMYDQRRTTSPEPLVTSIKGFDNRSLEIILTYQVF
ncbi:MAG: hypothetical protein ABH878_06810 [bacterium]